MKEKVNLAQNNLVLENNLPGNWTTPPSLVNIRERLLIYLFVFITMILLFLLLILSPKLSNFVIPLSLDNAAIVLTLIAGIMALIKYFTRHDSKYLFIGYGLLGATAINLYHDLIISLPLGGKASSEESIRFSFLASDLFLAIWFLISYLVWKFDRLPRFHNFRSNKAYYFYFSVAGILIFLVFLFLSNYFLSFLPFVIAGLLFIVFVVNLLKGYWKVKYFEHSFLIAVIIALCYQVFLVPLSQTHADYWSVIIHFLRTFSYGFILTGLLMSMYVAFEEVEWGKNRMNVVVQNIADAVFVTDTWAALVLANAKAEILTGHSVKEMTGNYYKNFFKFKYDLEPDKEYPSFVEQVIKTRKNQILTSPTLLSLKRGKSLPVSLVASPIHNEKKGHVIGCIVTIHDMTREKELAVAKDNFLSIAAHQLRTPLGSIRWNLEMLLNQDMGELTDPVKQTVEQIAGSNKRLIDMVNDLLNVSRIDQNRVSDKPQQIEIQQLINDVIKELQPLSFQHQVKINFISPKMPIPSILIDPQRLREVFQNLLSNAIKYNKRNGNVTIELEERGDMLEITIKDTGLGIPEEDKAKIFTKFFRAINAISSATEGSGLGLFVVKSYVEGWGGSIDFESEEGKGTKFTIVLPKHPKQHALDHNLIQKN